MMPHGSEADVSDGSTQGTTTAGGTLITRRSVVNGLAGAAVVAPAARALAQVSPAMDAVVAESIRQIAAKHRIPGLAIAVTVGGQVQFYNHGVASTQSGAPVTQETIFEIGSVSKTFTATLASYLQVTRRLALDDKVQRYMPEVAGSPLAERSLLDLATYTAGGLPLQFPKGLASAGMMTFYKDWRPQAKPGHQRLYSNTSIGLFGFLAARAAGQPFENLMDNTLFPALGLKSTSITIPAASLAAYAYGYAKDDRPVRVTPGILDAEAYGVKSTSADMIRFVQIQMGAFVTDPTMASAVKATRTGYYRVGGMVQGLGWEMYDDPAPLDTLLAGNSPDMVLKPNPAVAIVPPQAPRTDVLVNKTGSTNGFGAYVAFVPARRAGVVILANRNFAIDDRVRAAYRILSALDG